MASSTLKFRLKQTFFDGAFAPLLIYGALADPVLGLAQIPPAGAARFFRSPGLSPCWKTCNPRLLTGGGSAGLFFTLGQIVTFFGRGRRGLTIEGIADALAILALL